LKLKADKGNLRAPLYKRVLVKADISPAN